MQSEEDRIVMHVLHRKQGWSISEIADEFEINWRTAKRYATSDETPMYGPRACPARPDASQLAHIERRLAVCPQLRATTLHRELRELGYEGSYPTLVRVVRLMRPQMVNEPVIRFETDPGVQAQGDWADCGRWLLGDRLVDLYAWVTILGFSRMIGVRFATDKTRQTTLRLIIATLTDVGGVPVELLTDRDPALVIGSTAKGRAVFAPEWIDLAGALALSPRACRPRRAQTKGKVERNIREVKEDLLCWLTGQALATQPTIADYDALGRRWTTDVIATRRHRTTKRIIGQAWNEERALLRPISERIHALVAGDGVVPASNVVRLSSLKHLGECVEQRSLADYDEATS
jgi:transposase